MRSRARPAAARRSAGAVVSAPPIDFTGVPTAELKRAIVAADGFLERVLRAEDPVRKIEERLVRALSDEFEGRFPEALKKAKEIIESGELNDLLAEGDVDRVIDAMEPAFTEGWVEAMEAPVKVAVEKSYGVGRVEPLKPLQIKPVYNLVDDHARAMLREDTMYWIGNAWRGQVGPDIAGVIQREVIEKGLSRREAAAELEGMFNVVFPEKSTAYWRVVSAAATVRSRTYGTVESFVQAEVLTYQIVAVMDRRTSAICAHMNGKTFSVADAVALRDRFLAAETPEEAKAAHPWPKEADWKDQETTSLARAGILLPPFHGNCRTVVVPVDFTA